MKQRIIFYGARQFSSDAEILARMEVLLKVSSQKFIGRLRADPVFYIENIDLNIAEESVNYFKARGMDVELEPMALEGQQKEWFIAESRKWFKRGVVFPYQLKRLFSYYGVSSEGLGIEQEKPKDSNSLIRTVLSIGAIFIGVGIILFIAANWQRIPSAVKIVSDLIIALGFLNAAYQCQFKSQADERLSRSLYIISFFAIGSVILLMGQIYHVQAESYILPLVWGFLLLPVAFLLNVSLALYFSIGLWSIAMLSYSNLYNATPWFYPALTLGFLMPYSFLKRDKTMGLVCLGCILGALVLAAMAGEFMMASIWLLGLIFLYSQKKDEKYEALLLVGFIFWHLAFLEKYESFPNVFYIFPLVFFTLSAIRRGSPRFAIANIFNALFWLGTFYFQITKRFDLIAPQGLDLLLFMLSLGVFFYGAGTRLTGQDPWQPLCLFLRRTGVLIVTIAAYFLSFRFYNKSDAFYYSALYLFSTIFFFSAGAVWAVRPMLGDFAIGKRRLGELLVFGLLAVGMLLTWILPPSSALFVVIFNCALFFEALALMIKGHLEKRIDFYNFGIALFVLLIVSRYFDTLSAFMPRSFFFILGGVFLIAWAVFIDRQKKIHREIAHHD